MASLVSHKPSDSGLHAQLHPLALLTISDHITRHVARSQQGPIVGAILGGQLGREITLEQVFECSVIQGPHNELLLPQPWFDERLKQFKDVHKEPALDLVGWWTTAPVSGPEASHLSIHGQILREYNESAVMLAFHPSQLLRGPSTSASTSTSAASGCESQFPLTIYESVHEGAQDTAAAAAAAAAVAAAADGDKSMQVDGDDEDEFRSLGIRFRQIPYSIETGEAEMISVESVAREGTSAAAGMPAIFQAQAQTQGQTQHTGAKLGADDNDSLDGGRGEHAKTNAAQTGSLTPAEEDLVASLNSRLNAIKTLEARISLIRAYVSRVSQDYLSGVSGTTDTAPAPAPLSHPILRSVQALVSHLSLLDPQQAHGPSALGAESLAQSNDVLLVSLLGQLGQSIQAVRELGRKSAVLQNARQAAAAPLQLAGLHGRLDKSSTDDYLGLARRDGGSSSFFATRG